MKINILVLASQSLPMDAKKPQYPTCLQEVDGSPVLEHIMSNTRSINDAHYSFIFNRQQMDRFHLDNIVRVLVPNAKIVSVPGNTMGSACTALFVACALDQEIPILIISSNEIVNRDLGKIVDTFVREKLDGGVLTFHSIHPRYSYVRLGEDQNVVEVAQQNTISEHATTGVFWYAHTGTFVQAAKTSIRKQSMTSGQYYVAPVFNQIILQGKRVGALPIDSHDYIPLKSDAYLAAGESPEGP